MLVNDLKQLEDLMILMKRYQVDSIKIKDLEVNISFHVIPEPEDVKQKDQQPQDLIDWSV